LIIAVHIRQEDEIAKSGDGYLYLKLDHYYKFMLDLKNLFQTLKQEKELLQEQRLL